MIFRGFISFLIWTGYVAVYAFTARLVHVGGARSNAIACDGDLKGGSRWALYAKKRRSRAKAKSASKAKDMTQATATGTAVADTKAENAASSPLSVANPILGQGTIGGEPFVVPDLSSVQKTDSKLDPLAGTSAAKKKAYDEESNGLERFITKMTAPTPKGQEPEAVKLVKQITWVSVIMLVLIEIYVSVKVGGAPFDPSKATLPTLPDFKAFTGGAGPPTLTPP
jgi:hypothetical protein